MDPIFVLGLVFIVGSLIIGTLVFDMVSKKRKAKLRISQVVRGAIYKPKDSSPWSDDRLVVTDVQSGWVRYVSFADFGKLEKPKTFECPIDDLLIKCNYLGSYPIIKSK